MFLTEKQKKTFAKLNQLLGLFGVISFVALLMMSGFYIGRTTISILTVVIDVQMVLFIAQEVYRLWIVEEKIKLARSRIPELMLSVVLLGYLILPDQLMGIVNAFMPTLKRESVVVIYLSLTQFAILAVVGRKLLKYGHLVKRLQLHSGQVMAISFACLILFGTFLLSLPKAVPADCARLDFIDALFTATSGVCVTGLAPINIATQLSFTGQLSLMMLVQIGGFGVMTITALFVMFSSAGISFQMRVMMGDILSEGSLTNVTSLVEKIIQYTFVIEFVGAVCLYISLGGNFMTIDGDLLFVAIFHSITAFCNAGFSIFSQNLMEPEIVNNLGFLFTISWLIIVGGIGFTVLQNVMNLHPFRQREKRLRYQLTVTSKLVLMASFILISFSTLVIFFLQDFDFAPQIASMENLINSFFLAVSSRTAGFNNIDPATFAQPVVVVVILLMVIGAGPGSTAGGVKITTFAIVFIALWRMLRGEDRLVLFNREIHREYVRKALMIIFSYCVLSTIAMFLISLIEPDKNILDIAFETVSALSTVGLTRNLTPYLGAGGKAILICLMFIGRVGTLSFFLAFHRPQMPINKKLPKTSVMIG